MKPNLHHDDELRETNHLQSLSRKEPFKAPNGYFDSLTSKIQDKLNQDQNLVNANVNAKRPVFILAILLTVCISAGISFYLINSNNPHPKEIACTYDDMIESGYYSEFDESALSEKYLACQPSNVNDDKAIEDYLINNSDESLLTNQF